VRILSPRAAVLILICASAAACRTAGGRPDSPPPIIQPGAPGQASRAITSAAASDLSQVQYVGADIKFMQGMIGHHAQAVEMVALVPSRTSSDDVRKLAQRIDVSQRDEINMMQGWLTDRGQRVPNGHEHNMAGGAALMPGMLTPEQMAALAAATGAAFDRLFLEGMIRHHAGAITMVEELFATPGAGQDPTIFSYASDVDADQRMEIDRMGAMLKELQK
jgi:uncharacterized protein (DUF305 family)